MNDPIPDLRFTPTSPGGEALPIIFAATTRPDGSPVITIELAHGESIAEVLPSDRDRIMAALDRAIDAACWLVEKKPESEATANPREVVVVKCADGWWQVRTRDRKHWWYICFGWVAWADDQDAIDNTGIFRTEALARAALAKAPPPPEVGTPGDTTANPREAVVVQCDDGWLIATRDMKHWWSKHGVPGWHPLLPPFRVGNFRTEAEARAALAKAPHPPEVGT